MRKTACLLAALLLLPWSVLAEGLPRVTLHSPRLNYFVVREGTLLVADASGEVSSARAATRSDASAASRAVRARASRMPGPSSASSTGSTTSRTRTRAKAWSRFIGSTHGCSPSSAQAARHSAPCGSMRRRPARWRA